MGSNALEKGTEKAQALAITKADSKRFEVFHLFSSNLPVLEPQQTLIPIIDGNADENKRLV